MLHRSRQWSVWSVDSAEALATMLVQSTWTGCQAFNLAGYLFVNDATSSDGAQEYAVLKPNANGSSLSQIESITFSWCSEERVLKLIREILLGEFDANSFYNVARDRFSSPAKYGTCFLCA